MLERAFRGGLLGPADDDLPGEEVLERYGDQTEEHGLGPGDHGEDELTEDADDFDDGPLALLEGDRVSDSEATYRTTAKGEQAFYVGSVLQRWLGNHPGRPLKVGPQSGETLASLICCWSATVTHALAREPLTLAELDRAVLPIENRETVEEHVEAMERAGHARALPGNGETRYALTDWMREGIAPLAAAARMEVRYPEPDVAPPDVLDVEAIFQLALPLLRLPPDLRGSCRLGVQIPGGPPLMAGATAEIDKGSVVRSSTLLEEDPETWATGTPLDWLDTLIDPGAARIKADGDTRLTDALLKSLHERLFTPAQPTPPGR